jgi:hypothetical protein
MTIDLGKVGQDGSDKTPEELYDSTHGRYQDSVEKLSEDQRFPTKQFPQGQDPAPFTIKGGAGG